MESINVIVDDESAEQPNDDEEVILTTPDVRPNVNNEVYDLESEEENNIVPDKEASPTTEQRIPSRRIQKNHPVQDVIGDINEGVQTHRKASVNYLDMISNLCFVSKIEPKNVQEALNDEYWVCAMQEELGQFERNAVWELVPKPNKVNVEILVNRKMSITMF